MNRTWATNSGMTRGSVSLCLTLLVAIAGCGGSSGSQAPTATLAGQVQVGGQPLPADAEGVVQFFPSGSGQAQPVSAPLKEGRYEAEGVPLGQVLVLFNITRLTGKMTVEAGAPNGSPYPERENLVPEAQRQGITLEVAGDNAEQNFDL